MAFQNSVVGGVTLVRPAIQSPDFQSGVSGWKVDIDGSAEFNDVTIRGGTVVSGTALYYNGAPGPGKLVLSISAQAGTDEYGNTYPAGYAWHSGANKIYTQDTSGNVTLGSSTANSVRLQPVDGTHIMQAFDSSGNLAYNLNANTGALSLLQNGLTSFVMIPTSAVTNFTSGGIAFGSITSAGSEPTTTQIANAGRVGLNNAGVGLNVVSPAPAVAGTRGVLQVLAAPGSNVPQVRMIGSGSTTNCDLHVNRSITSGNMRWGTAQAPTPGGSPGQTFVTITFDTPMPATPVVTVTANSASTNLDNTNIRWSVANKSTTGFTINCWRDTNAATNFEWFAVCN